MKEILYDWGGANIWLFHAINDMHAAWWDRLMLLGTYLGWHANFPFYLLVLTLLALAALGRPLQDAAAYQAQVRRWVAVIAVFSMAYWLDGLLLGYLKPLMDFPRPPLALPQGTVHIVGEAEFHHSLPSGHASFAMVLVASLWPLCSRRWRVAGAAFVAWVGISRISLGAHFPADVLAGFASSLFIVALAYFAVHHLLPTLSGHAAGRG